MEFLRRFVALPLLVVPGCSLFDNESPPPIVLSTVASPADLRLGDTARVVIDIQNVGRTKVLVGYGNCNLDFVLTEPSGQAYYAAESVYCTLELRAPVELHPGESHRVEGFTTGRVVAEGSQEGAYELAPGTYGVHGRIGVQRGRDEMITVISTPASITFRARN